MFKEKQRFNQPWILILLALFGCIPIYGIYKQLYHGEYLGNNPMSDKGLIVFAFLCFSLIGLFLIMKLEIEIDDNEIKMRFFPFVRKTIKWKEVKSVEVIKYGFVGGWGIRTGTKYGTVYNTRGNIGLKLELLNGKKLLIGTQKQNELKEIIEHANRNR